MARPLVIFPIFPPFRQFYPAQNCLNNFVRDRLLKIDRRAQPFHCVDICTRYLEWRASEFTNSLAYNCAARALESMLMWSFERKISLFEWDSASASMFLECWSAPPVEWTSTEASPRYVAQAGVPFCSWPINERWRLFRRKITPDGGTVPPVYRTRSVLIQEARGLFDFYNRKASSPIPNPFPPGVGTKKRSLALYREQSVLDRRQLDWVFEFLDKSTLPALRASHVGIVLAFARYTSFALSRIVGSDGNPGSLSQFQRNQDGSWVYTVTGLWDEGDWCILPPAFVRLLENHLKLLHVDPGTALPSIPLFPQITSDYAYSNDSLKRHLLTYRAELSRAAECHVEEAIRGGASKFHQLTTTMVRRSARANGS